MAASRALVTMPTGILLMFVLAVAVSAGGGGAQKILANRRGNNSSEATASPPKTGQRAPVADRYDMTGTPHRHLFKAEHNRKAIIAKPPHPNKVHKQISHPTKSGHIKKGDLPGSKKTKSKVSLNKIKRVTEELIDESEQISPKTETNMTPLEVTKPDRHVFNIETDKNVSILKTPELKKEHKHTPRQTKSGRIQKVSSVVNTATLAKEPKLSHKKSDHVSNREFVAGEKKLTRGKWGVVAYDERPLCKPHDSTVPTTRSPTKQQAKLQRIVDSYHKTAVSERRDVLMMNHLENKATRLLDSFPGPLTNSNEFPDNWAANGFVLMKAHNAVSDKVKRCAECTQDTKKNAQEDTDTAGQRGNSATEDKLRVKKSVETSVDPDNVTLDWDVFNDVVKTNEETDMRHCIPTQTFAVGLICMSVILSICFLVLWRKTDQPEKMYALAYIVACIVYVILALVYLGSKSADYVSSQSAEK